jgi:hypothetical protein
VSSSPLFRESLLTRTPENKYSLLRSASFWFQSVAKLTGIQFNHPSWMPRNFMNVRQVTQNWALSQPKLATVSK